MFVGKAVRRFRATDKDPKIFGPSWGRLFVEFNVTENFHGAPNSTVAIELIGACDYQFIPGIEYFVVAQWWPEAKTWIASMCGRSGIALQKHGEIEVLRAASKGSILYGVLKGNRQPGQIELLEGATVQLKSGDQTFTAKTGWFGDFIFSGLKGSEFELSIDSPGWRIASPKKVALGGGCTELQIFGDPSKALSPPLPH